MATEDDNLGKIGSRTYITSIINNHFKDRDKLTMFDFLGAGVGAEYYLENVSGLAHLTLLDSNKLKINKFLIEEYRRLVSDYAKNIDVFNMDATNYFVHTNVAPYDILNLDFCSYFYENGTPYSTRGIIETAFQTGAVSRNGVLLCTFQIKGYGINMQMKRQKIDIDPKSIAAKVKAIANKYTYDIEEEIFYEYQSSPQSRMLNIAFRLGE